MFAPSIRTGYYPNIVFISQDKKTGQFRDSPCPPVWMDSGLPVQKSLRRRRLYSPQSSPALQQPQQHSNRLLHPYSSPLPQTHWSSVPSPPPQQYEDGPPEGMWASFPSYPTSAPPTHHHPPPPMDRISIHQTAQDSSDPRRRQRRKGFHGIFGRSADEGRGRQVDVSRLYPPSSPYEQSRLSTHSAPDELEHRHLHYVSQSSVPGYMVLSSPSPHDDPVPMSLPRTPTYPPSGRRRMHSATGVGDAALADEEEFRLFVEATAGLGPEQAHREPPSHHLAYSAHGPPQQEIPPTSRSHTTGDLVSPLGETPTTMFALQQIAQMPEISPRTQSEPRRTSFTDLDRWLQAPGTSMAIPDVSPVEDTPEDDDELPDYAQSQAQAHDRQRAEATRRAQELQRRWQQSGSRRGI